MAPRAGTGERRGYATALAGLWTGLSRTLSRLDEIAAHPGRARLESLPALQYRLHCAAELVYGIDPPPGAEPAHAELLDALEQARDLTAELAQTGDVPRLLHQWRGALFRVRLARDHLTQPPPEPAPEPEPEPKGLSLAAPLAALTGTLIGAVALATGAVLGPWPLWAAGLVVVVVGLLVYRP